MKPAAVRSLQLEDNTGGSQNHNERERARARDKLPVPLLYMNRRGTLNVKCGALSGVAENSCVLGCDFISFGEWILTFAVSYCLHSSWTA
jgi:hypothetical protein